MYLLVEWCIGNVGYVGGQGALGPVPNGQRVGVDDGSFLGVRIWGLSSAVEMSMILCFGEQGVGDNERVAGLSLDEGGDFNFGI